jgi:hypothetical protein
MEAMMDRRWVPNGRSCSHEYLQPRLYQATCSCTTYCLQHFRLCSHYVIVCGKCSLAV